VKSEGGGSVEEVPTRVWLDEAVRNPWTAEEDEEDAMSRESESGRGELPPHPEPRCLVGFLRVREVSLRPLRRRVEGRATLTSELAL
jgi:hypothetical protein